MALQISVKRCNRMSAVPPKYPSIAPMTSPIIIPENAKTSPNRSAMRIPWTTRAYTSRPPASMPNGCSGTGRNGKATGFGGLTVSVTFAAALGARKTRVYPGCLNREMR